MHSRFFFLYASILQLDTGSTFIAYLIQFTHLSIIKFNTRARNTSFYVQSIAHHHRHTNVDTRISFFLRISSFPTHYARTEQFRCHQLNGDVLREKKRNKVNSNIHSKVQIENEMIRTLLSLFECSLWCLLMIDPISDEDFQIRRQEQSIV